MMKYLMVGVWAVLAALGGAYGGHAYVTRPPPPATESAAQITQFRTDMTGVPILQRGQVTGYVVFQMVLEADVNKFADPKMDPQPYFMDAAFRAIFENTDRGFSDLRPKDLDKLTGDVVRIANERMGEGVVKQALIEQLNFIRRDEIRQNWFKK